MLESIEAGDSRALQHLVGEDRLGAERVVESLLRERDIDVLRAKPDSAGIKMRYARSVGQAYAGEFSDSICLNLIAFHLRLSRESLIADTTGWARYQEASRLYRESRWEESRQRLEDALVDARRAGDMSLEGYIRTLSGSCFWNTGSFDQARVEYEVALELAREIGHSMQEVSLMRNIAASYSFQQRNDEAIESLRKVLEIARRTRYWEVYCNALNDLGINLLYRGDLEEARAQFEEVLILAREYELRQLEGNAFTNLGLVLSQQGEYSPAISNLEQALQIARETGNKRQEMGALLNLASLHADLEQHSDKLVLLRDALRVAEQVGAVDVSAQIRNEIGETYCQLRRPHEALRYHEEALPVLRRLGIVRSQAIALNNIAIARAELGQTDKALAAFAEVTELLTPSEDPAGLANVLAQMGWVYWKQGDLEHAEESLQRAMALADTLDNAVLLGNVERMLGQVLTDRGELHHARTWLDRAIDRGRQTHLPFLLWRALVGKANLLRKEERLIEADTLLAEAIGIIESIRGQLKGSAFRLGFMEDKQEIYGARVDILSTLAEEQASGAPPGTTAEWAIPAALRVAEKARARVLCDVLSGTRVDPGAGVDSTLRENQQELSTRLSLLQSELSQAASAERWEAGRIDSLARSLEQTRREYRATLDEIAARNPAYGVLTGQREPLEVAEIRERVLADDQVLLEYLIGKEASHLFWLDESHLCQITIPVGADTIEARVRELRHAVLLEGGDPNPHRRTGAERGAHEDADSGHSAETDTHGDVDLDHSAETDAYEDLNRDYYSEGSGRSAREISQELYTLLLAPVASKLKPGCRLLIVPDGPLFYLPFALLHDGESFLVERHPICTAPSASVLDPALWKAERLDSRFLVAVGNPSSFRSKQLLGDAQRSVGNWSFGELPHAEEEVRLVAQHFPHAQVLVGDQATEEAVKAVIGRASHLHFATHGMLDEDEPLMSALILAQDEDPSEDGFLQVHEILELDLSAHLATLSACNTGLGHVAGGEGVIGLTHAFLYAGVRTLLISLWEVPDRSTAEFMEHFYTHLEQSPAADVALQAAQIASIKEGGALREWAPFILTGTADLPPPGRHDLLRMRHDRLQTAIILTAAAGLLFGTTVLLLRARRRKRAPE
ncbi:MAG: CHAT domain-containing protein [Candidatus Eisenbacteria sp.]|nr:CHAT domain-containing protein [Candidatus Eisenbacteria bacterium]